MHSTGPLVQLDSRWALCIAAIWGVFAAIRLSALAGNAMKTGGLWRRSTPIALSPALEAMLSQPGLRHATLCSSEEIDQPCVIGFLAPRILVPGWLLQSASASELEQIVLHESAHLRRFDDWSNLAQKLLVALFPLSPALLWIERRLCAEREIACDESVVCTTHLPREYATCLTNLAEQRLARRTLSLSSALSLGAWERRSQLAGRIESILLGGAKLGPLQTRALALALVAVTVGGAMKLGGSPQLVSFASAQPTQPMAQTEREGNTGPHYQNVVFHPQSPAGSVEGPLLRNDSQSQTETAKQPKPRPVVKHLPHHAQPPANGVESIVIFTRWQTPSGAQVTRIDKFVRISAQSTVPPAPDGWFFFQL
jgi:beta-lactamase regulating signal transducer with metallopeptidase domain